MNILVLNAGSSSFKASLYRLNKKDLPLDPVVPLWTGKIDCDSAKTVVLKAKMANDSVREERSGTNRIADIHDLLNWLWSGKTQIINSIKEIDIVGHRVVYESMVFTALVNPVPIL